MVRDAWSVSGLAVFSAQFGAAKRPVSKVGGFVLVVSILVMFEEKSSRMFPSLLLHVNCTGVTQRCRLEETFNSTSIFLGCVILLLCATDTWF